MDILYLSVMLIRKTLCSYFSLNLKGSNVYKIRFVSNKITLKLVVPSEG